MARAKKALWDEGYSLGVNPKPSAEGIKNLRKLARMLDRDADNKKGIRFDLSIFGKTKVPHDQLKVTAFGFLTVKRGFKPELSCGTTACAVGYAALSGKFKGLSYTVDEDGAIHVDGSNKVFDLTNEQWEFLFEDSSYEGVTTGARGERKVAKRIRQFCAGEVRPHHWSYGD